MAAIKASLPRRTVIGLRWQDKARVGQKNGITRRWAKRGTRRSAPKDQRTTSVSLYGAICPAEGKGAALVLPRCNTEGMTLHLAGISAAVAPGDHAELILDQAGWHLSAGLVIPDNITLLPLPPKCPERNPVENVWQFRRDNGCRTASSKPATISPTSAASPGTASPINRGPSCLSDCASGRMGEHQ